MPLPRDVSTNPLVLAKTLKHLASATILLAFADRKRDGRKRRFDVAPRALARLALEAVHQERLRTIAGAVRVEAADRVEDLATDAAPKRRALELVDEPGRARSCELQHNERAPRVQAAVRLSSLSLPGHPNSRA